MIPLLIGGFCISQHPSCKYQGQLSFQLNELDKSGAQSQRIRRRTGRLRCAGHVMLILVAPALFAATNHHSM